MLIINNAPKENNFGAYVLFMGSFVTALSFIHTTTALSAAALAVFLLFFYA